MKQLLSTLALSGLWVFPAFTASANPPVINAPKAGDTTVSGMAEAGSVPITIYDTSYPARTALGSSKAMDKSGNFAVVVSPKLINGHALIAVDANDQTSQPVIVDTPSDGPAGPAN